MWSRAEDTGPRKLTFSQDLTHFALNVQWRGCQPVRFGIHTIGVWGFVPRHHKSQCVKGFPFDQSPTEDTSIHYFRCIQL